MAQVSLDDLLGGPPSRVIYRIGVLVYAGLCVASLDSVCLQVPKTTPQHFHCQSVEDECNGAGDCADPSADVWNLSCDFGGDRFVCGYASTC